MQPHIHLEESLGIPYAIMPGDPARVERIAAYLDQTCDLGSNREYRCISGTFRGVRILAVSTGIGGPSAAIAVEELRHTGVSHMIRIGSCGALQPGIRIGDLILAQGAVRDEGTSAAYVSRSYSPQYFLHCTGKWARCKIPCQRNAESRWKEDSRKDSSNTGRK